ncbi:acyl-CoA dehydrogenase family protein [Sciscionella marina]|uniref:acyl-CoA dehydrogenase family protein n=1 Tax=Sciscionella marina TaxID=508770 RepID=UPI00037D6667|nr:acyl-CoA dehydrogenase family protein [Sciscionella marina]
MTQETISARADAVHRAAAAAEQLATGASGVDSGEDARPGYRAIRESGLLRALLPRDAGGFELSFSDYTKVLETLATGSGSGALGFNMHNVAIGSLCESSGISLPPAAERFCDWAFAEVVHRNRMFASATSEPGSGAKLRGLSTTYTREDGGFVLRGEKSFVSLAGIADYYVVAAVSAAGGQDEISHFVVSKDDPGVRFGGIWDGAALRGTETASMTLDAVPVGADRLFLGVEGASLFKLVREPHWMVAGYLGAYLGVGESVVRYVTDFVAGQEKRRDSAVVRSQLAELVVDLHAARAQVYAAAGLIDERRGSLEANTAVHVAKYLIGELVPSLATRAIRICGSTGLRRSQPLERLLRESVFCSVMPAKPDECLDYIGKSVLGFNMFHAHTVDW